MADTLHVETREKLGTANNRRLRWAGKLPAVLYGHGEDPQHLTIPADEVRASLRHGSQVVQLEGAVSGQALFQEIQWDTFQMHLLHVDLLRVKKGERIQVTVPVATRGVAPGEGAGGIVEVVLHEVEIETSPAFIPESLHININHLELHDSLSAKDIEGMPEGAKLVTDPEQMVVHCIEPAAPIEEEEAEEATGAEPEIIGRDAEGEGDEGES